MTLQEILAELNVEFVEGGDHRHSRPGWINLDCPFCQSKGKYHLGYNLHLGYFTCWRCSGKSERAVLSRLGLSNADLEDFLAEKGPSRGESSKRIRKGLIEPPGRGELTRAHSEYLEGRGFDPEEIARIWSIEGLGHKGRNLAWRIYIPIIENETRVSWTTRAIGEKVEQRYVSASFEQEAVNHKEVVYGLDFCLHSIVVVEGPTDAWKLGPGAGALFGTAFSAAQVRKLSRIPRRVVCFDNSGPAQRRASELCNQLSSFPGRTINIQIDAKDPGSARKREVALIRKVARL